MKREKRCRESKRSASIARYRARTRTGDRSLSEPAEQGRKAGRSISRMARGVPVRAKVPSKLPHVVAIWRLPSDAGMTALLAERLVLLMSLRRAPSRVFFKRRSSAGELAEQNSAIRPTRVSQPSSSHLSPSLSLSLSTRPFGARRTSRMTSKTKVQGCGFDSFLSDLSRATTHLR